MVLFAAVLGAFICAVSMISAFLEIKRSPRVSTEGLPERTDVVPVPLSPETERLLEALFPPVSRADAAELLVGQCGANLPMYREDYDRIRFAVLKLSKGDMDRLREVVQAAKVDWRDVLWWAGFAGEADAHRKWFPK